MAELCLPVGCPSVLRFALVDGCTGEPQAGAANGYAVGCPRNYTVEKTVREGESSEFISDCGFVAVRDVQDDQQTGTTISFEVGIRSNELEALLTGKTLISSGGNNIGTYSIANQGCTTPPAPDPRFVVEAFYKLSRCTTAANHVRYVYLNTRWKVTELDREGTITYYRYTGVSEAGLAYNLTSGLSTGPFNDFPADIATFLDARPANELSHGFDFEETITIAGSCGTIAVP
jgi:hypothetical protein